MKRKFKINLQMHSEVKINVTNVHIAEVTVENDILVFGKVERIKGAMEFSRTPKISSGELYGDGKITHSNSKKSAYDINGQLNKFPTKWRRYLEGVTSQKGVESASSKDSPNFFAIGWEVEKTGGKKELIWFPYCKAEPITETIRQSEDNINYSTDSITIKALEHDSIGRFYTFIDSEDEDVTEEMIGNFFKKVQTTDLIEAA